MDSGLSPATMRGLLSCLRQFLRYARDVRQLVVMDPDKIRGPRVPFREVEYLTKEEVMRFLDAFPSTGFAGPRDRALAELLCGTGMRISEALALDREGIDWEAREALVIGKGGKQRKVYFSEAVLRSLRRYLDLRRDNGPALFVTQGSTPQRVASHGTWKRFRRYARSAGLTKAVYPHMLRHTMATTLMTNGCPVGHIRVLLGHAHLATTCRYYLGRMSDAEAKAAQERYLSYEVGKGMGDPGPGQ
jgi:integrase/recombinase XerD